MKIALRILVSVSLLTIGYEVMVEAFHQMNMPSDANVYEGMALLVLLALSVPLVLYRLWRS